MVDRRALREVDSAGIFFRLVAHDRDALHAFRTHLISDHVNGEVTFMRLAARHGDRVIVENFVGDVCARSARKADRHGTGMIVGAIAEILEEMLPA